MIDGRRLWPEFLLLFALCLNGCFPSAEGPQDEQKESHFLRGRAAEHSQDYKAAIYEFEKALDINPRSASAHFELGWLYEEEVKDYAEAIHHYQRHLALRPNSEYAERARERIKACKMDLAKSELVGPLTQGMQRDLERLTAENLQLKKSLENLQAKLGVTQPVATVSNSAPSRPTASTSPRQSTPVLTPVPSPAPTAKDTAHGKSVEPATPRPKTHIVQSGETIGKIAQIHNLKIEQILKANPNLVNPRLLKVGDVINLPPQ